ncbi:hypothetical protein KFK09_012142 [Dendrobium nobile]|uniref:Transmembrane protein n=1 Tax=Dendrobium nobile TaxID=94219 RepID=A0A8T3BEK0_DENNO|nr:hypothetical protein KFK09_012142 [Dendrobium nobile]
MAETAFRLQRRIIPSFHITRGYILLFAFFFFSIAFAHMQCLAIHVRWRWVSDLDSFLLLLLSAGLMICLLCSPTWTDLRRKGGPVKCSASTARNRKRFSVISFSVGSQASLVVGKMKDNWSRGGNGPIWHFRLCL